MAIPPENSNEQSPQDLPEGPADVADYIEQEYERAVARSFTSKDVVYLFDQCPFLQLVNADYATYGEVDFKIVRAKSGWDVHHYGDALSASPGLLLFGGYRASEEDKQGGDQGGESGGTGTIVKQAFDTTLEMIELAIAKGWGGIMLIDGHPMMQWAAWMHAYDRGYILQGYNPIEEDFQKRERLVQLVKIVDDYRHARTMQQKPR